MKGQHEKNQAKIVKLAKFCQEAQLKVDAARQKSVRMADAARKGQDASVFNNAFAAAREQRSWEKEKVDQMYTQITAERTQETRKALL